MKVDGQRDRYINTESQLQASSRISLRRVESEVVKFSVVATGGINIMQTTPSSIFPPTMPRKMEGTFERWDGKERITQYQRDRVHRSVSNNA